MNVNAAVFTEVYPTKQRPYFGAFVRNQNIALEKLGINLTVYQPRSLPSLILDASQDVRALPFFGWGAALRRIGARSRGEVVALSEIRNVLARAVARTHQPIVHAHFLNTGIGAALGRRSDQRLIIELWESSIENVVGAVSRLRAQRALEAADAVICVSTGLAQYCENCLGVSARSIHYMPNGYNPDRFYPRPKEICRKELGLPLDRKIVLFCGQFIERKGPLRLLDALNLLGDVQGIFLGAGPQIPKGNAVLRTGVVPNAALPAFYNAADLLVLPSLAEGMATVVVEAIGCGTPVCVSDLPFNRAFLRDDEALFCNPRSAQSIAEAIDAYFALPERYEVKQALRQRLSLEKRANEIGKLYDALLP